MTNRARFTLSMRLLHWAMALLIIAMLAAGLVMVRSLEPWQYELLWLHKSFGIAAALLVLVRLLVRWRSIVPALPSDLPYWQRRAAKASHWLLYTLMVLMPLSGLLMQYFAARPVSVFDVVRLPAALTVDIELFSLFRELHGWAAGVFIGLVIMHIAAALYHHYYRRDDVLRSMWK